MKKLLLGLVIVMFSFTLQSCSCCCPSPTPDTTELLPFFVNSSQQTTISQETFTSAEELLK